MKRFYWISEKATGEGCYLLTWKEGEEGMPASKSDKILCQSLVSVEGNEDNVRVLLQFAADELRAGNTELFVQDMPFPEEMMILRDGGEGGMEIR